MAQDVLIIGAGLTGLTLAYYLRDRNLKITIVEGNNRIGGRILTHNYPHGPRVEMGATWLGKKHLHLNALLKELNIGIFEQALGSTAFYEPISTSPPQIVALPPNNDPSYRIATGSYHLIDKLHDSISSHIDIKLNQKVSKIEQTQNGLAVHTSDTIYQCQKVISTIPPYLLKDQVSFDPPLPSSIQHLLGTTHTWMGDSIKVGLTYAEPFWRKKNLSGTIVSNVGPISEMYDHTDKDDQHYSLKGFLNGAYHTITKKERLGVVLRQLQKYYGSQVESFLSYEEKVWRNEPFAYAPYTQPLLPHQNNGHSNYRQSFYNGSLYIAGSETAKDHPGYMDGAISSATEMAEKLMI